MLLFDDSKILEKALGEEAAAVVVHVFEKMEADNKRELATRADLEKLELATRADLEKLELATRADLEKLELATRTDLEKLELATRTDLEKLELRLRHDLTLRLGGMMAASIAIVAALVKLS